MYCPKCGFNVNDSDAFCQKCGCNLKVSQNQAPSTNVKVVSTGVCPHCGKLFSPEGSGTYKLLKVLSVVVGIFFGLFALLTLINIFSGAGEAWVFALFFGAGLLAISFGKKKVSAKMDKMPCPYCGKNRKGETVGTPSEEIATFLVSGEQPGVSTPTINQISGETKMCARCRAQNEKANKACSECGFTFGKIISATDGKHKFGLVTCPGCGSVYQVKKNVPFIVIMALLGMVFLSIWMPGFLFLLNLLLAGLFITLAILHAVGKLKLFSLRRCTACKKTAMAIFAQRKFEQIKNKCDQKHKANEAKRDQKLLQRTDSAFVKFVSSINTGMVNKISKANLFPFGTIVSVVIWTIMMFITNEAVFSWEGIIEGSQDIAYLDAILNYGGPLQIIPLLSLVFLFTITIITNFIPRLRLSGIPLIFGLLTGIVEFLLFVANFALQKFEYPRYILGEWIVYEGQYSVGIVNTGIIVSAVIMIAIVFMSYMIEKEKRYLILTAKED